MTTKADRAANIHELALRLAQTGKYRNWLDIEKELHSRGHSDARKVLNNKTQRKLLDRLCDQAKNENSMKGAQ